ncbi:MAG: CPBP family intramembrane glutamic endopeptidase [Anaerolineales bacterium]
MKNKTGKRNVILRVILSVVVFSFFIKIDTLFSMMNTLAEKGWPLLVIILTAVVIRMFFAGLVVLIVLPLILGFKNWRSWLPEYLRVDSKIVLTGFISFGVFCTLAAIISVGMGIFKADLSTVFSFPDIRPDPDVIGWGYFLLALVPAIWEELAFRGLIQSKLRKVFSIKLSILLSAASFGIFHFSNLLTQSPAQALPGVILALFFGIGWGYLTVRTRSVVPAMISHYLVDSMGQIFLNVDNSDPALTTGFFLLLTLLFPVFNILLARIVYKEMDMNLSAPIQSGDLA